MIPPRSVFFGTEGRMTWIKAPAINVGMSKGKWTSSGVMLNGGAYELNSNYAHRRFDFAWNLMSPEEVRKITRYFDGVYGEGLLYYLDPFAMNSNVLPLSWSTPRLAADDAPPLVLDQVPTLSPVVPNSNDLPVQAATYTLSASSVFDSVFIPVPDGEGLNIGVVGSRTGTAAVTFTPRTGSTVTPTLLGVGATNLISNYLTGTGGGVTVSLSGTGTITLVGMQARVSSVSELIVPYTDGFVAGEGHSGLRLSGVANISGYSAPSALNLQSISATLTEVGAWEPQ